MKTSREFFGNAVNIDWIKNPNNDQVSIVEETELDEYLAQGYERVTKEEAHELTMEQ